MVAGVGLGQPGILAALGPVEGAAVYDDAAKGGAVTADELGGGVDNDVRAVLNGPDQIGGAEGVVNDQGQAVAVGDFRDGVNVGNIGVGIAKGFNVDGLGVGLNGGFHFFQIMGIHKAGGNAPLGKGVGQQIAGAAINGLLGHDVLALLGQCLNGIGDGGGAGGNGQTGSTLFQGSNALFKNLLGGVGQTAVDVAGSGQAEPVGGILAVGENIGGGGVNGHRPGIGGGIGLLLAHMQLQRFKTVIRHRYVPLFCMLHLLLFGADGAIIPDFCGKSM